MYKLGVEKLPTKSFGFLKILWDMWVENRLFRMRRRFDDYGIESICETA